MSKETKYSTPGSEYPILAGKESLEKIKEVPKAEEIFRMPKCGKLGLLTLLAFKAIKDNIEDRFLKQDKKSKVKS